MMANNTKLRALGRRGLSFFMALVMAISLIQITAFAKEGITLPDVTIVEGTGGETTVNGSSGESITGSKTIAVDPDGDGNDFIITLGVTTVSTSTTSVVGGNAAHVVLVIDRSGSMGYYYGNAIVSAKSAATDFANTFLGEKASANNKLAVVSYADNVTTNIGLSGKSDLEDVTDAIDEIQADGGTLTQGGIATAQEILEDGHVDGVKDIIVLLSDGAPTYSYKATAFTKTDANIPTASGGTYDAILTQFGTTRVGSGSSVDLKGWNGIFYFNDEYTLGTKPNKFKVTDNILPTLSQAKLIKDDPTTNTEVFSILMTSSLSDNNAKHTMKNIASDMDHYKEGNMGDLAGIFQDIANTVTSSASGSVVTDPMGSNISLGDVIDESKKAEGEVNVVGGTTLKWDLAKATPDSTETVTGTDGKTTTTTYYELQYKISVTRNAAFYDAIKANGKLPTNGETTMPYQLGSTTGTLNFKVPEVTSVMPTIGYTVNYYKQNASGEYVKDHYTSDKGDYDTTFAGTAQNYGENYFFNVGMSNVETETESKTIGLNSAANVINLYYSLKSATITVAHMLQTTTLDEHGTPSVTNSTLAASETVSAFLGTSFDARSYIKTPTASDGWKYDAKLMGEKGESLTIDPVTGAATITIWYSDEIDSRLDVKLNVTHHYETHNWVYNETTKTWEETVDKTERAETTTTGKYGTTASATVDQNYAKYLDHTVIDGTETDDQGLSVSLTNESGHKIDLYYVIPATNEPAEASYQIVHHYKLTTVTDAGSETNTYTDSEAVQTAHENDVISYDPATDAVTNYNGVDYTLKTTAASDVTLEAGQTKIIDIFYEKDATTAVDVTVNYEYEVYQQVIDSETGKKSYELDATPEVKQEVFHKLAGNLFTLTPNSDKTQDYEKVTYDKVENVKLVAGETYEYTVLCQHYVDIDSATEGDVTIVHNYYTLTTYYNDEGELQVDEQSSDGSTSEKYYGVIGDEFSEDLAFTYGDNSDYQLAANDTTSNPVKAIISGKDRTVTVNYYRSVDRREGTETTVTVTPVLVTRTKTANADGTFAYTDTQVDGTSVTYPTSGKLYAGQKWSATPEGSITTAEGKFDFNSSLTTDQYVNVILGSIDNPTAIRLHYLREVEDLTHVTVIVRHTRTDNHYDVDTGAMVPGTPAKDANDDVLSGYYVNKVFSTKNTAKTMGYDVLTAPADFYTITAENIQTVVLDGKETKVLYVDWAYTKDHYPMKANVVVNYKASLVEYSTKEVLETMEFNGSDVPFNVFVGEQFTASDRYLTFTSDDITTVTLDGENTGKNRTFRVSENGNEITIEFVMYQDSRQDASVLVKHDYFDLDTYTSMETKNLQLSHEELVKTERNDKGLITNDIYVGAEFTAVPDTDTGDYNCRTDAAKLTFTLEQSESNATVEYVKTTSSDPGDTSYFVRHDYYLDGELAGSVNGVGGTGKVGATINGNTDVTPVTNYNGADYTFSSATSVILSMDGENLIVMTYERTSPSEPIPPVRDDDDDDDDTGYKPGEGPFDKVVVPDVEVPTTELPEVEVPTTEQPETNLEDPAVPMAEAPKTGDNLLVWVLAAAASGLGLVYLTIAGKKRKDEDAQ